ncbi:hypothetical protein PV325_003961 [Microctonus aethiopoides]|nr:hypothetical protein PV325_003961 [Microctonus aethiopoides]
MGDVGKALVGEIDSDMASEFLSAFGYEGERSEPATPRLFARRLDSASGSHALFIEGKRPVKRTFNDPGTRGQKRKNIMRPLFNSLTP